MMGVEMTWEMFIAHELSKVQSLSLMMAWKKLLFPAKKKLD